MPDFGAAREGDLVHAAMIDNRFARLAIAGDDIETPAGIQPRARFAANSNAVKWRELGGFEHHRIASRERRCDLPSQHQQREIPRNNLPDHTHRHLKSRNSVSSNCAQPA